MEVVTAKVEAGKAKVEEVVKAKVEEAEGKVVAEEKGAGKAEGKVCLLYTSPSPRDVLRSRMPSSA